MAIGSHTVTLGGTEHAGLALDGTTCERGSFTADIQLRSVILTRPGTAAGSAKAVVYADDGSLLASGVLAAIPAGVKGDTYEVSFSSPVALTAGTVYRIGAYRDANIVGGTAGGNQHTHSSTPTLCDWNEFDTNLYYSNDDSFPALTLEYELDGAFSFDPNALSAPLTPVAETDTAQAVSRTKRKTIATVIETDAAPVFIRQKSKALEPALETDSAPVIETGGIRVAIATVTETDEAPAITRTDPATFRYRLTFPTYPRSYGTVPIGHTVRFVLDQAVSIVRVNGTLRQFRSPGQTQLHAAGTEGVDWFIGGRIYEQISNDVAIELRLAGFETERVT